MNPREYLFSLNFYGIKLGLENITRLLNACENPQHAFTSIHVAGTNGKGSVLAFSDAILQAAGFSTGRFTSPHLIHPNERFLIDRIPISNAELDDHILFCRQVAEREGIQATFFELNTAIAFRAFAAHDVDFGLIEVGMGGRLDATNVITPAVTAITAIGYDHTEHLGTTIESIAGEKAGIVKTATPLVIGARQPQAVQTITRAANRVGAPFVTLGEEVTCRMAEGAFHYEGTEFTLERVPLGLPGNYQCENAAISVAVIEALNKITPLASEEHVTRGLVTAHWPCRIEHVLRAPDVYIDIAHNAAGAEALAGELSACVMLFAAASDKDTGGMLRAFQPIVEHLIISQFKNDRAMPAQHSAATAPEGLALEVIEDYEQAIEHGINTAHRLGVPLLITGSIFGAGQARAYLMERYNAPPLSF